MEEKTVRKIMSRYFEIKQIKAIPTQGAGPDFLEAGKAIEIKGSGARGARFNPALTQFAKYAFKYSNLEVALPIDVLSADNLIKFTLLCRIVLEVLHKSIKTYLIAKDGQQYFVKSYYDGSQVLNTLLNRIPKWSYFKHEFQDVMNKLEVILPMVDRSIQSALLEEIRTEPDMKILISEIEKKLVKLRVEAVDHKGKPLLVPFKIKKVSEDTKA